MAQVPAGATAPATTPHRTFSIARVALVILGLAALVGLGRQAGSHVPQFAQWVNGLGVWGPLVFILGYAVAAVAFVPGSLLARRDRLVRYPEIARGEDTAQALAMLREGTRFARLSGHGYLYVYVFHGSNSFDHVHHAMISRGRCLRADRLLALEPLLRARLAEYAPPLGAFTMPYEGGRLEFRR